MTTTIIVKAHCSKDKEVHVSRDTDKVKGEVKVLQDRDIYETVVYDDLVVTVKEVIKK